MKEAQDLIIEYDWESDGVQSLITLPNVEILMIEFARLHVEAALEAAYNMVLQEKLITEAGISYFTNIYPLTLIK